MSECKHRCKDGVCLKDLEYVYKGFCVEAPCTEFEPQTNADKLRSMTDEKLAEWLHDIHLISHDIGLSNDWWLDWLKQEAE